jgi:riboflavin synthase alpha subunit
MSKKESATIRLSAEIGTEMSVELPSLKNRITLTLIGILNNEYLIFHLPQKIINMTTAKDFSSGIGVNIRSISRGSVFGFHASIISKHTLPESALFISYPKSIQTQVIRKSLRVKCLFPASVSQNDVSLSGTVADISEGGCNFQAKKESFNIEQVKVFQVGENVTMALSLPGIKGETSIDARIINLALDAEKVQVGLAFNTVEETTLKIIDDIIAMSFDISPL